VREVTSDCPSIMSSAPCVQLDAAQLENALALMDIPQQFSQRDWRCLRRMPAHKHPYVNIHEGGFGFFVIPLHTDPETNLNHCHVISMIRNPSENWHVVGRCHLVLEDILP
jgi:hypothetical protein